MAKTSNIYKDKKTGAWYFVANLGKDIHGKRVQKFRRGFKTKGEAKQAYLVFMQAYQVKDDEKQQKLHPKYDRFEVFFEEIFLPWYETQVKISTFSSLSLNLRKQLTYFYGRNLSELSALDVHAFQQHMLGVKTQRGFTASVGYVNLMTTGLSTIFERAIVYELMAENWVRKVGKLRGPQKKKIEFWTMDEYKQFEAALSFSTYKEVLQKTGFRLLFMTGMRIGEMLALNWEQVDFEEGMITIEKTLYYRSKTNNQLLSPKTKSSQRRIGVDSKTLDLLSEWLKKQSEIGDMNYVCQLDGSFMSDEVWSRWLKRLSVKAEVQSIKLHALRHSHASMLISIGESPLVIQKRLGHHDIEMTLGTYGHLYPDASQKLTEKLSLLKI